MAFDPQFKVRNLPDQLADHIVVLLANGDLKPGQRLIEKELCETLGVSRIPVREALRILQAQGVVRTEPNRGSFITEFGSADTLEMLEIRVGVERTAARRLLRLSAKDPDLLKPLRESLEEIRRAARMQDPLTYCKADLGFHSTMVDLSGSPLLKPIWQSLSRGVFVFLMQERSIAFDYDASIRDHEQLLDLLVAGDIDTLVREIEDHIVGRLVQYQSARTDPAGS